MAWEKRGSKTYFYRSRRQAGRVRKVYYGGGPLGRLAAEVDALRRAEEQHERDARRARKEQLDAALALSRSLGRACGLLVAASLLAAGFHRPGRHRWRKWWNGRRVIKQAS